MSLLWFGSTAGATGDDTQVVTMATFDGVSTTGNTVDCGNDSSLQITSSVSCAAWVKTGSNVSSDQAIISKWSGSSGYILYIFGGEIYMQIDGTFAKASISTNTLYHFLGTYDGSNIKIYVNGTDTTQAHTGSIGNPAVNVFLGKYTTATRFGGAMFQPAIWNTALDSTAASDLYNGGTPRFFPNYTNLDINGTDCKMWLPLGDDIPADGQEYDDRSTSGNDGTNDGSTFGSDTILVSTV